MDVVVLLSGGKDSCFSMLKARMHGHRIVALAHISPSCEEADSFMYQSVGSNAVAQLAQAFGFPLMTRSTRAQAKRTTLQYAQTEGDEVEDLVSLLVDVKATFPHVAAVCSGALWSDYQRLRVENAARRVGLLSLAPLWRRNQGELLDEMIAYGVDAVLIKVAGVGLNDSHLGKSLLEMQPTLQHLNRLYGSHICGEGGEYETLVRWIPGMTRSLFLDHVEVVMHSINPVAPVCFLRLKRVSLRGLTAHQMQLNQEAVDARRNVTAVDSLFRFDPVFYAPNSTDCQFPNGTSDNSPLDSAPVGVGTNTMCVMERSDEEGAKGVERCCIQLMQRLGQLGEAMSSIISVQLYLHRVDGVVYKEANRTYNEFFYSAECVSPPARACVGIDSAGSSARTILEALVHRGDRIDTRSLHVQSISEWAPPCIGPYSQFIEENGVVHVSGVLPLYAPSVTVLEGMPADRQVQVCWHNLQRTLEAGRGQADLLALIIVYSCVSQASAQIDTELKRLTPPGSIAVQVPVRSLPKGAAVEIKAVGTLDASRRHLHRKEFVKGLGSLSFQRVVCSNLSFVVIEGREPFDGDHALSAISAATAHSCRVPLSVVVHLRQAEQASTRKLLHRLGEQSAISIFSSAWMPHSDLYWIAFVTAEET